VAVWRALGGSVSAREPHPPRQAPARPPAGRCGCVVHRFSTGSPSVSTGRGATVHRAWP